MKTIKHNSAEYKSPGGEWCQQGVGMIEVLVAVLLLAVGILGLAGMQLTAKRAGNEAHHRTTAIMLSQSLLEKIRNNPHSLSRYVFTWISGAELPVAASDCAAARCTTTQMAAYDINQWVRELRGDAETQTIDNSTVNTGGLPDPAVCVQYIVPTFVSVTISWRGHKSMMASSSMTGHCSALANTGLYGTDNTYMNIAHLGTYISPP